ncbi:MAG TPA: hypothetical protein VFP84_27065 [Kofleriaceae bacterium]|nr:hypothetical protein [Kofleriaceae bacterium]
MHDDAGPVADAAVRCAPDDGEVVVAQTARDGAAALELAPARGRSPPWPTATSRPRAASSSSAITTPASSSRSSPAATPRRRRSPGRPHDERQPPTACRPDGRFSVESPAGKMMLVVPGQRPTFKPGLVLEAGKALDVGDVTVDPATLK